MVQILKLILNNIVITKKDYIKKISYNNSFFDINIVTTGKHTSETIEAFKKNYVKQMERKCYQVIGVNYDTLINKNTDLSRYEKAVLNKRDSILFKEWCFINKINNEEKQVYFSTGSDDKKSFYENNKKLNPVAFTFKLLNNESSKNVSDKDREDLYNSKKKNRTSDDNKKLETTRQNIIKEASSHQGNYSRKTIIYDVNKGLLNYDFSVENFVNTSSSSLFSIGVGSIVYLDQDIKHIKNKGMLSYVSNKTSQFGKNYISIFSTQVLTNHLTTTIGLCNFADNWTDDFISNFIAPNIYCSIGIFSSLARLKMKPYSYNDLNEGEKVKMITENFFIINSKYIIHKLDAVKYAFTKSQIELITSNMTLFKTFLTTYHLSWMLPLGKAILVGLFIRFLGYLITKDKCNIDIVAYKDKIKNINRINKAKTCIKILNDPNVSKIHKELVYEEMIRSNMILRKTPKRFKII